VLGKYFLRDLRESEALRHFARAVCSERDEPLINKIRVGEAASSCRRAASFTAAGSRDPVSASS
jgi:hypothetical protein